MRQKKAGTNYLQEPGQKSEKGKRQRRINSHRQLVHAFPRLGGFKTLLEADLDPLGMLVDISRTEKGRKGVALTETEGRILYATGLKRVGFYMQPD